MGMVKDSAFRDADDFPGVGADVTKRDGLNTHFGDAVVPTPSNEGDWGGTKQGYEIAGGQKGVTGILPEVTTVDVQGAPPIGGTISEGAGGEVANKSGREVIGKIKG